MNLYIEADQENNSKDEADIEEAIDDDGEYDKDETRLSFLQTDQSTVDEYAGCRNLEFRTADTVDY